MFADVFVQYLDSLELFSTVTTSEGLIDVVYRLHVIPQIGNAAEQSRAQFAHEPLLFGVHDQMIC